MSDHMSEVYALGAFKMASAEIPLKVDGKVVGVVTDMWREPTPHVGAIVTDAHVIEVNPDDRTTTVECDLSCECGFRGTVCGTDPRALLTPETVTVECPGCWTVYENVSVR